MTEVLRLPVTISATRKPLPRHDEQLHKWAAKLCAEAAHTRGYLASQFEQRTDGAVTVSLTFDSAAALAEWEASEQRIEWLAVADRLTDGAPDPVTAVRLQPPRPPPRWRTAIVVWAGLFPFSLLFTATAGPVVATLPVLAQSLITSVVLVPLAVYIGIPVVNAVILRCGRCR